MNRMVYNPNTGIYEQSCEFEDMYNSNMMSRNKNSYDENIGNTCIGGNAAFMPGYKGYNASESKRYNNAAIKNQYIEQNARQTFAQQERERYVQKQENISRLSKVAEQNYKKSSQCAHLKEEIKAEKMLANMRKK
jgi:hypothetical protein